MTNIPVLRSKDGTQAVQDPVREEPLPQVRPGISCGVRQRQGSEQNLTGFLYAKLPLLKGLMRQEGNTEVLEGSDCRRRWVLLGLETWR